MPQKYHKAIEIITRLLKYTSIEEYVNSMIEEIIKMELDGAGKLESDDCIKLNEFLSS
jgi:hypothetical protein